MKIGILTHYYGSNNYGGVLQAYALTTYLRKRGYDAEQICYKQVETPFISDDSVSSAQIVSPVQNEESEQPLLHEKKGVFNRIRNSLYFRLVENPKRKEIKKYRDTYLPERIQRFTEFKNMIPHSSDWYDITTISDANDYDCYITGSDQVWSFKWFNPAFFLEPFSNQKKKIAYAASAGKSEFEPEEKDYLKKVLPTFDSISVREADLVSAYTDCVDGIHPQWVLDPVFLLDRQEWDTVSSKRLARGKYIFAYFLGNDREAMSLAKEYAKKTHRKLVVIPFARGIYSIGNREMYDLTYGDRRIDLAAPPDFISLIKYADCVITDSFHATAFSIIYRKNFFTFERSHEQGMSSRIQSIINLTGCGNSFCNTPGRRTVAYMLQKPSDSYSDAQSSLEKMKNVSYKFLDDSLSA